jgi:uncharacterized protein YdeI (YjbR/CyaY-like superfamily)
MNTARTFTARLEPDGTALNWIVARIPFDVAKAWPQRRGRRVRGSIAGFAFRTSLFPDTRGSGHFIVINKKMQAAAKAGPGSRVHIVLEPDLEEREALLPAELAGELGADRRLKKWFEQLSLSMRREIAKWVAEPASPESRRRRAVKMAERLMLTMEGEFDPPPVLRAFFQTQRGARDAWEALTPIQRRQHLLGIFYYETPEARERRAAKALAEAMRKAQRRPKPGK